MQPCTFVIEAPTTDYEYSDSGSEYSDSDDEYLQDSAAAPRHTTLAEQARIAFLERQHKKTQPCAKTPHDASPTCTTNSITLTSEETKELEDGVIRAVWCKGRWGSKFSSINVAEQLQGDDIMKKQDVAFMKCLFVDRKKKSLQQKIQRTEHEAKAKVFKEAHEELQKIKDNQDVRSILRSKWLRHVISNKY